MIANDWGDLEHIARELLKGRPTSYPDRGESGNWDRFLTMLTVCSFYYGVSKYVI